MHAQRLLHEIPRQPIGRTVIQQLTKLPTNRLPKHFKRFTGRTRHLLNYLDSGGARPGPAGACAPAGKGRAPAVPRWTKWAKIIRDGQRVKKVPQSKFWCPSCAPAVEKFWRRHCNRTKELVRRKQNNYHISQRKTCRFYVFFYLFALSAVAHVNHRGINVYLPATGVASIVDANLRLAKEHRTSCIGNRSTRADVRAVYLAYDSRLFAATHEAERLNSALAT
jgi:hypothetical protein